MDNNGGIHHGNGCEASAHINVWSNELDYCLLRNYYEELFADMYDYFYENRTSCEKLFGRHMSGWCNGFSNYEHACFINTEACKYDHPRLEFRCSCYRNNKQYMNLLKFCNEVMRILVVNFIRKVHDGKDAEHAARIASGKIMKQVEKYVEKAYTLQAFFIFYIFFKIFKEINFFIFYIFFKIFKEINFIYKNVSYFNKLFFQYIIKNGLFKENKILNI